MPKAPAKKEKPPVTRKATRKPKELTPREKCDAYGVEQLCTDILGEKTLTAIAEDLGISIGTLLTWIEANPERSARAREARARTARLWDEKATKVIEDAADPFELAKAKELSHHYRWRASKIAPRDYGDKLALGQADDLAPLHKMTDEQLDKKLAEFHASKG